MAEILVIDDMAGVRHSIEVMLQAAGHRVTGAADGAKGLALANAHGFDLIIVDIVMPNMDGTEFIFELAAMPGRPPILAMSGGGAGISANEALRMARFKADGFIEKPFERSELKAAVEKLVAKAA